MSFRDLTQQFHSVRSRYVALKPIDHDLELGDDSSSIDQPHWQKVLACAKTIISNLENELSVLCELSKQHTSFSLNKNIEEEEKQRQQSVNEIEVLFQSGRKVISSIAVREVPICDEDMIKKNVKQFLTRQLNDLLVSFRTEQMSHSARIKNLENKLMHNRVNYDDAIQEQNLLQISDAFTDEQIGQVEENEKEISQRDKELREVLFSISDLNETFVDFSSLATEQGALLDRIDYNIDNACQHIEQGNENLLVAEKRQRMSGMTLCVLLLILLVVVVVLLFGLRLVLKFFIGL
jgi:syntaxin 16